MLVIAAAGTAVAAVAIADGEGVPPRFDEAAPFLGVPAQEADVITLDQAARLETALASQDPAELEASMTSQVAAAYRGSREALLPAGSVVDLELASARVDGGRATVPVAVSGPRPGRWLLHLVLEDGSWSITGTTRP